MILKLILLVTLYFIINYLMKNFKDNPIHRKIVLYFDYIFIFRPTLFFIIWFIICLGMYSAYLGNGYIPQWLAEFNIKTCLLFIAISLIMASIFVEEGENKVLDKDYLDKNLISLLSRISLYLGLLILFFINIYNFILGLSLYFFWYFLYRKDIVKNNFFIKSFMNVFISLILLFSGFFIIASDNNYFLLNISNMQESIIFILLSSLCLLTIFLFIELTQNNDNTITDKKRYISFFCVVLLIIVMMISIIINEPLLSLCTVVSVPFYIYALLRNLDKDIIRSSRYPLFIFNFFIVTLFPYLGLALVIVFYFSKYYYWYRFNVNYPTFLIHND